MKNNIFKRVFCVILCLGCVAMLAACKKTQTQPDVPLTDIADKVKEAYGDAYIPQGTVDETALEQQYGLTTDMYKEAYGEVAMISVQVDAFIAVHANEGKADAVEEALNKYRDYLINDAMNYPMNIGKVNGSTVYRNGDYVFFIMLGDMPTDVTDQGEEAAKTYAQEQNQIAVKAIEEMLTAK